MLWSISVILALLIVALAFFLIRTPSQLSSEFIDFVEPERRTDSLHILIAVLRIKIPNLILGEVDHSLALNHATFHANQNAFTLLNSH